MAAFQLSTEADTRGVNVEDVSAANRRDVGACAMS